MRPIRLKRTQKNEFELTKMSDNSKFARADNGKMRAANESYALKMNIIVILHLIMEKPVGTDTVEGTHHCLALKLLMQD